MQKNKIINFNKKFLFLLMIYFTYSSEVYCSNLNLSTKDKTYIFDLILNKYKQFTINMFIGNTRKEMTMIVSTLNNNNIFLSDSCTNCSLHRKYEKETSDSLVQYSQKSFLEVKKIIFCFYLK